ncbi:MAG: DUF4157 domain-containing protein [Anaerolineae bacterium]|nr:DUF4157 domain-containing protein [Anaerolineae bacterium]
MLFKDGTVESQATILQKLPSAQQQSAVQHINRVQGNRHVQQVISAIHRAPSGETQSTDTTQLSKTASSMQRQHIHTNISPQTKLTVSEPGDQQEIEADQVADQVMKMPAPGTPPPDDKKKNEPEIKRLPTLNRYLRRDTLQKASDGIGGNVVSSNVQSRIEGMRQSGEPLPESEREFFEPRMGVDLSNVRIHTGSTAAQTSKDLNARAYTVGSHVAFNSGEYQPGSTQGRQLMAHELTHVVQQGGAGTLQREPAKETQQPVEQKTGEIPPPPPAASPDGEKDKPEAQEDHPAENTGDNAPPVEAKNDEEQAASGTTTDDSITADESEKAPELQTQEAQSDEIATTGEALQQVSPVQNADKGKSLQEDKPDEEKLAEQAPDSTEAILKLVEEVKTGGLNINELGQDEDRLKPTGSDTDVVIQRTPTNKKEPDPVDLGPLRQQAQQQRRELLRKAQQSRQQVTQKVRVEQSALKQAIRQEQQRLNQIYPQQLEQIQLTAESMREQITAQRDAQIQRTNTIAELSTRSAEQQVQQRQHEVLNIGKRLAQSTNSREQMLIQLTRTGCAAKAREARQIGASKAAQYSGSEQADEIAKAAHQMAEKLARGIEDSGREMRRAARKDMADLARKFTSESRQTANEIRKVLTDVRSQIQKERRNTIKEIRNVAKTALQKVRDAKKQATSQVKEHRKQALDDLRSAQSQTLPKIADTGATACEKIDQDTAAMIATIDAFVDAVSNKVGGKRGEHYQDYANRARDTLREHQSGFLKHSDIIVGQTESKLRTLAQQTQQHISTHITKTAGAILRSVTQYESKTRQMTSQVINQIQKLPQKYQETNQKAHQKMTDDLRQTVSKSRDQWEKELQQGVQQVRDKINKALAQHSSSVAELGGKIDQKAREIEAEAKKSLLEKALDFIGDIVSAAINLVVNIVTTLIRVILTVLVVILAVLALIIVVAFVITLIVGLVSLLLSIFAGLGAFLATLLAVGELLLKSLFIVLVALLAIGLLYVIISGLMALVKWDITYLTGIQSPTDRIPLPEGDDYTDWLLEQMQNNAEGPLADQLRDRYPFSGAFAGWYRLVAKGGIWDFKVDLNNKGVEYVKLGDKYYRYDVLANIHFGYVGRSVGFPGQVLLAGAGVAQVKDNVVDPIRNGEAPNWNALGPITHYCDDSADRASIQVGMELYERFEGRDDVSQEEIEQALIEILEAHDADLPQKEGE